MLTELPHVQESTSETRKKKGGGNCRILGRWRFFCFLLSIFVLIILKRPWCDESNLSHALGRVLLRVSSAIGVAWWRTRS
jgi:hypothetical protein